MKFMNKIAMYLFSIMFVTACSVANESTQLDGLTAWQKDTVYPAGQYVQYNGEVFKSTTATRNISPTPENISERSNPMGAWARSTKTAFRTAQRQLSVSGDTAGTITAANLADIPAWNSQAIYNGSDLVQTPQGYFKSMWWNQNNNPDLDENKNNHLDASGVTHWGPWVVLTDEQALEELKAQQGGLLPPTTGGGDNTGDGDNTGSGNTGGGGTTPPPVDPPTGETTPDDLQKFMWNKEAIYLENDLAAIEDGGKTRFFRSKWWNLDHTPLTYYEFEWDSPWQEISEKVFNEYIQNGGITPPAIKPIPPTTEGGNTGGGGTTPPPVLEDGVAKLYETYKTQGYIQEWSWDELPQDKKDAFNKASLNGRDILSSRGDAAIDLFTRHINQERWNMLFPRRRGSKGWYQENPGVSGVEDYFSYNNFIGALATISEYAYMIEDAIDPSSGNRSGFIKTYVLHKPTKKVRLITQDPEFVKPNNSWLVNRTMTNIVVDYAAFGSEGTVNDKARGIAGFLAHAAHETSGSWATAPGYAFDKTAFPGANFPAYITTELPGLLAWSLYFNEEVAYAGVSGAHYVQAHNEFPASAGQSYHGRGAFQLSWNYNYGLASAIFFGTSKELLDRPELIVDGGVIRSSHSWSRGLRYDGGTLAFLTSLMFWLTPQGQKPSQQDAMILNSSDGRYVQGRAKLDKAPGLGTPGYGWTINIMNGGFEAGKSWEQGHAKYEPKVERRVKHYLFFTQSLGGNNDGEILDTVDVHPY